jgi:hypothetical protein
MRRGNRPDGSAPSELLFLANGLHPIDEHDDRAPRAIATQISATLT